jgi:hypothetical protein
MPARTHTPTAASSLQVRLLRRFFVLRPIEATTALMGDFFGGGEDDGYNGSNTGLLGCMFKEAPEIFMCEMRLRAPPDSDDDDSDGGGSGRETPGEEEAEEHEEEQGEAAAATATATATKKKTTTTLTTEKIRLARIHEMWAEICAEASEER